MIKKYFNFFKKDLFRINRSITGNGVRKTLLLMQDKIPELKIKKINCGKKVYDWKIPAEWIIKEAYVLDKNKKKIIDFKKNNLHVVGYSKPINKILYKKALLKKIHSLRRLPNAIPYMTSYYKRDWGFCISYKQKKQLENEYSDSDKFFVKIKSNFKKKGHLNYGEVILKGASKKEILISTYICHPSMANNELSGPLVSVLLINYFKKKKLNKTLRFVFIPETIGSIGYIYNNYEKLKKNVIGGYNLSCIGDNRMHSCMFSKNKGAPSDEAIIDSYKKLKIKDYKIYPFLERGSDERQYNSPGIDLNISSIFRTKYMKYKEYHTSLDDFKLVTIKGITGGFKVAKTSIEILQKLIIPEYRLYCEPFLQKRGIYNNLFLKKNSLNVKDVLNFLQYANGKNTLQKISKEIKLSLSKSYELYKFLLSKKLIK